MKKRWIEYSPSWQHGPMTFWVHIEADGAPFHVAQRFNPPAPKPIPGKGYATYYVQYETALLWFASLDEMRVCMETLSQKVLPSSLILTQKRGASYGPSNYWLNRIPLRSMTWAYRQRTVKYLNLCLTDFKSQLTMPDT